MTTYGWATSKEHDVFGPGETAEVFKMQFQEVAGWYRAVVAVVHVDDADGYVDRLERTDPEQNQQLYLTRLCGCGGRFEPVYGSQIQLDADGSGSVDTQCPRCGAQSGVSFTWEGEES